jgi:hypothetical protein
METTVHKNRTRAIEIRMRMERGLAAVSQNSERNYKRELAKPCVRYLFVLGQVIASLSAFQAVVLAILAQPDGIRTLAQGTVFLAIAVFFYLLANHAAESFGHGRRLARIIRMEKSLLTMKNTKGH